MLLICNRVFLCACLLFLLIGGLARPAAAQEFTPRGWYLSFHTGVAAPQAADAALPLVPSAARLDFDSQMSFSGALGVRLGRHFRLEGEGAWRRPDIDNATFAGAPVPAAGDLSTMNLMLNTYYDFSPGRRFNPYLTAGIGAAHHRADLNIGGTRVDDGDTTFAWAAGAGLSYSVNDRFSLTGGYRYMDHGKPDFGALRMRTRAHEFRIGITIKLTPAPLGR